jgi:hypothetical protein
MGPTERPRQKRKARSVMDTTPYQSECNSVAPIFLCRLPLITGIILFTSGYSLVLLSVSNSRTTIGVGIKAMTRKSADIHLNMTSDGSTSRSMAKIRDDERMNMYQ